MATQELTTVQAHLPPRLLEEMQALVADGWYRDLDDLLVDALRRYLDARRPELMERFFRQDVEWGLRGED
jgi:Arc/MetJ-type ribon-helix-helix transcriptional regulator